MERKQCPVCGQWFESKWVRQKYDTMECAKRKQEEQLRGYNSRKKKGPLAKKKCIRCPKMFYPAHGRHVYCNPLCRMTAYLSDHFDKKE